MREKFENNARKMREIICELFANNPQIFWEKNREITRLFLELIDFSRIIREISRSFPRKFEVYLQIIRKLFFELYLALFSHYSRIFLALLAKNSLKTSRNIR